MKRNKQTNTHARARALRDGKYVAELAAVAKQQSSHTNKKTPLKDTKGLGEDFKVYKNSFSVAVSVNINTRLHSTG